MNRGLRAIMFAGAAALTVGTTRAEPSVVASGAYPEGLLWQAGRLFFTQMGADRVSLIEKSGVRDFWRGDGCGPTSLAVFGPHSYLVTCHLGREVAEISDAGATGLPSGQNRFRFASRNSESRRR